ncbi:efflux RND transporter permease subunit [Ramlibacter sp.]|uniref:efflux RND transporter permease subunit n=1 Tax=Ramlibacter sp. TaxID=1917967 RepID=UPI00260ED94F|nr:efflux RND transporter permease subunit [Ramlibacter sp.]MDB5956951.1 superfamily exporter [Ramlibacter sp.]
MKTYAHWLLRVRWWVIAVISIITAVLGLLSPQLKVTVDPSALVPSSSPTIQAIDRINDRFGSKYMVLIGVTPKHGDIFQPAVLERVQRMTAKLATRPEVVQSNLMSLAAPRVRNIAGHADGFDALPLMDRVPANGSEMSQLKAALQANPVYLDTIVSRDFKTAAILVELKEGFDGVDKLLAPITAIARAESGADVDIAMGGNPVFIAKSETFGRRINLLFPLAILVIGLLHFEAFRTRQGLILPLVTAVMAVVWGMGTMGLLRQSLDIFNSPTPILILAIAAGHAVQLLKRYYEEYERLRAGGTAPREANVGAIVGSMASVGPVMMIAGGVAALGFFSLIVFDIPTIRSFGIFTGVGILSAVLLEMTFIPAVRSLLRPPSDSDRLREAATRIWDRIPARLADLVVRPSGRRLLYGLSAVAVALMAFGMEHVVVDNNSKNYFSSGLDIQHDDRFLNGRLAGTNTLYVMVEGSGEDAIKDPGVLASIERLQRHIETRPEVGKTLSIVDFLKRMNRAVHADDAGYDALPTGRDLVSQYLFLYAISGQPSDFDAYVDDHYRSAKVTVLLKTGSNAYVKRLVADLDRYAKAEFPPGVRVSFGGDTAMTVALSDAMVYGKLRNILQICVAVFLISALVFSSVLGGLIVLLPVLLSIFAVFGVMGLFGIPLNIPNSLISAMAVGIGADYAIYILYRFREQIMMQSNVEQALRATLGSAGKACLFVATAVAGGYGVLALSFGYNVHLWLSLFIVVAMIVSALASLTLVPAIVLSLRPAFMFGASLKRMALARQVFISVAVSAGVLLMVPRLSHAETDEAALMQKSVDAIKVRDSDSSATFTLTNRNGESRRRTTSSYTKLQPNGSDNMRLVKFLSPSDINGTATLMVEHADRDDDLWVYLPALKKVRRLAAANKKDSFVGTDFSYGDMIGFKVGEWTHRLVREEQVDGVPCDVIESLPKQESVKTDSGYSRRLTWVRKDTFVAVQIDVWDVAGQPLKRMTFADLKPAGSAGKWQAMRMSAANLQTGHSTVIEYTKFEADRGIGNEYFSPRSLEQ